MRMRIILTSTLLALSAIFASPAAASPPYVQTCKYFEGVAFNDQVVSNRETFRMVLATDCRAALNTLLAAQSLQDARLAIDYLDQLHLYRATLLRMAMERFSQQRGRIIAGRKVAGWRPKSGELVVRPVSRTGAFLIAKSMGLVAKQREWTVWREAQADP